MNSTIIMGKNNKKRSKQRFSRSERKKLATSKKITFYPPALLSAKEQGKIRSKIFSGCKRAFTSIDKTEQELEVYYQEDLKQFDKWQSKFLTPHLTRMKTLRSKGKKYFDSFKSISETAFLYDLSLPEAYMLVNSKEYLEYIETVKDSKGPGQQEFSFNDFLDEDDDDCDCEFCRAATDEDSSTNFYANFLPELEKLLKGITSEQEAIPKLKKWFDRGIGQELPSNKVRKIVFEEFLSIFLESDDFRRIISIDEEDSLVSWGEEISRLYKSLAKELHPDIYSSSLVNSLDSKALKLRNELWHRLQDGYSRKDLTLLKNIEIQLEVFVKGNKNTNVPVSDLMSLREDLRGSNKSKRKEIQRLRKGGVWGFGKLSKSQIGSLEKKRKQELKEEERNMKSSINSLQYDMKTIKIESKRFKPRLGSILQRVKDYHSNPF